MIKAATDTAIGVATDVPLRTSHVGVGLPPVKGELGL